ncbi:MAG: CHAT domain-containing protein [Gemmataceae bacterium]|nr:CHAT domain-containing protein [Gemmataceae bacterium]
MTEPPDDLPEGMPSRQELLDRVDEVLHPESGIKSLSPAFRERVRQTVRAWSYRHLGGYVMRRLGRAALLDRYIPAGLIQLHDTTGHQTGPISDTEAETMFAQLLDTARVVSDAYPVQKTFLLTQLWAIPVQPEYPCRAEHWWLILATVNCFSNLGDNTEACRMIEADLMPDDAAPAIYAPDQIRLWLDWMPRQEFAQNLDADKALSMIATLAHTTASAAGRKPEHGLALLEGLFGFNEATYTSPAAVREAIRVSVPYLFFHAGGITQTTLITCLTRLSRKLLQVVGRDVWPAVTLLDGYLRVDLHGIDVVLRSDVFRNLSAADREKLVVELSDCYRVHPEKWRDSVTLLESWFRLTPQAYASYAAMKATLDEWFAEKDGLLQSESILLYALAGGLFRSGAAGQARAELLLRAWLHLDESLPVFRDHHMMRAALGMSRLVRMPTSYQASLLAVYAKCLTTTESRARRGVLVLEAWLGIDPADYGVYEADGEARFIIGNKALRARLEESPLFRSLGPFSRIDLVESLADCHAKLGLVGMYKAGQLVEYLGCSADDSAELAPPTPLSLLGNPLIAHSHPESVVRLITYWLLGIGDTLSPLGVEGACRLVEYIRSVRDEQLPTLQHRAEFLGRIGLTRRTLSELGARWVRAAAAAGEPAESLRIEALLLGWLEELENRLLVERIRGYAPPAGPTAYLGPVTDWPFPPDRPPLPVQLKDQYLPGNSGADTDMGLCEVLGIDTDWTAPAAEGHNPVGLLPALRPDPTPWGQMIPPGAVWLRFAFTIDGTLLWWAYLGTGKEPTRLAAGSSRPGAQGRLDRAVRRYDLGIDLAWLAYRPNFPSRRIERAFEQALEQAAAALAGGPPDGLIAAADVLQKSARLSTLADLLRRWQAAPDADLHLASDLREAITAARAEPRASGNEPARRARLDNLTDQLVAAVASEVSLADLEVADCDWPSTDLIVQPQGSLWAAPLEWLSFGGKPLYEQVASIGHVVSLATRAGGTTSPPAADRLVSAQWLAPPRKLDDGLALLHVGLKHVAGLHNLAVCGLAESPAATVSAVAWALTGFAPRVAVIAGHGVPAASGVRLMDRPWSGGGAALGAVELLVLVACAVGRVRESDDRDVIGLYAELAAHHARSVVAARWPIADREAATFAVEVVEQYLRAAAAGEPNPRARALARARRALVGAAAPYGVSRHLAAAFEVYGAG